MSDERHAQVKEIFLQALELRPEERDAFLREQCGEDSELLSEVETLIGHHDSRTILTVRPRLAEPKPETSEPEEKPGRRISAPTKLADETRDLLRRRLQAITIVLSGAIAVLLLRRLIDPEMIGVGLRAIAFAVLLGCLYLLRNAELGVRSLRMIELTLIVCILALGINIDYRMLQEGAARNSVAEVVQANDWSYIGWSLVILIYGVFMPNTWRRAALVLLPLACAPYVMTAVFVHWDPRLAECLGGTRFSLPLPAPFLAAFTSIYAAHLIHSHRSDAFEAKRYAQYLLVRRIGKGGMGEVFEAEHLLLKRPCAVKLIHEEQNDDATALKRFEREVRAAGRLTHPNSIEIFDYGETTEGEFYCVMELLPGMSLASLVAEFGALPAGRAIYLLRQVCGALTEAHEKGMVHRDIKPGNIFAAERGGLRDFAKLLDFGLVRETKLQASGLTAADVIAGTVLYMAPEQAMDYRNADARSDIYSLGCVAYYLVTGRPPFVRDTLVGQLMAHAGEEVEPPSKHRPVPADLEAVIMDCLIKNPDERIGSASELDLRLSLCASAGEWSSEQANSWWSRAQTHTEHQPSSTSDAAAVPEK